MVENVRVGDIVLVQYLVKFRRDKFRLGRVLELHPDPCGVVRMVTVGLRDKARAIREPPQQCWAGLRSILAPVQRLVMILPKTEQKDTGERENRVEDDLEQDAGDVDDGARAFRGDPAQVMPETPDTGDQT